MSSDQNVPAEIATAVSQVMGGIKKLGKDNTNQHQRYDFVSTDKFLAAVNPLCAEAGLVILQDEESTEIKVIEGEKKVSWLVARYAFTLAHKSGATWGTLGRTVMVQANGAQAFGSAQSYALKQFMRSLFQIPTGDKDDADLQPADDLPAHGRNGNGQRRSEDDPAQRAREHFKGIKAAIEAAPTAFALDAMMKMPATLEQLALVRKHSESAYEQLMERALQRERAMVSPS